MLRYVLILGVLTCHAAFAQTDTAKTQRWTPNYPPQEAPPSSWVTVGYGSGPLYLSLLTSFAIEVEKHHLLTARFMFSAGDAAGKEPPESFFDFAALYGYSNDNILWFINVSAGLSCIIYNHRHFFYREASTFFPKDIYKIKSHVIPGLVWQFQVFSRFSKTSDSGLGFNFGGSFNKVRTTGMLTLSLILGFF